MSATKDDIEKLFKYLNLSSIRELLTVTSLDDETAIETAEEFMSKTPSPIYDNACLRLIYYHSRSLNEKEKLWDITIRWLKVCVNVSAETNLFFEHYKLDREEEVQRILFDVDFATAIYNVSNKMLGYFNNDNERKQILTYLLRNWFLPRYDFESVEKLIKQFPEDSFFKRAKDYSRGILNLSLSAWKVIALSFLPFIIISLSIFCDFSFMSFFDIKFLPIVKDSFSKSNTILYNTPEVFTEIIYLLLFLYMLGSIWLRGHYIFLKSPRLFIGIIIGYIPLLAEETFIKLSSSIVSSIPVILVPTSIMFFFLSYLYLSFEIKKATGTGKKEEIRKRTFKVLAQGVNYSFFLGLILLDIFSLIMPEHSENLHCGIIGVINPLVLLFFFPIALFLGVVVQFIWEEKPITHPIK